MRDKKISILLIVSFLLLLASFLILCTWVYNYYSKDRRMLSASVKVEPVKDVTRDSLLHIYTSTIKGLEDQLGTTWNHSDSLEENLSLKLDEFYRLKDEVATLLKKPSSTDDFKDAKQKITELQQKLEALRNTNRNIEQENSRLYKLLAQINKENRSGAQSIVYQESRNEPTAREQIEENKFAHYSTYELSLTAIKMSDEADDPFSTGKEIVGSFVVKNSIDFPHSELMVVVTQPNGQVLQKSAWESGSFHTENGKKIYSCKLQFEYAKGDVKKFTVSLNNEKFQRGTYIMQVYHNGKLIGKISKNLS